MIRSMKLSERMADPASHDRACPVIEWIEAARTLEAELDHERARAQDLAARLDRERFLRQEAERVYLAVAEASGAVHHQSMGPSIPGSLYEVVDAFQRETVAAIEDRDHAVAVLHLVYSMREHALRGRIRNQRGEIKRLHAQLRRIFDTGERTLQGQSAVDALREIAAMVGGDAMHLFGRDDEEFARTPSVMEMVRERLAKANADYLAIAEATGIMYEADGCASAPGPLGAVLQAIEAGKDAMGREAERMFEEYEARATPPVALEASDGGARMLDKADQRSQRGMYYVCKRADCENSVTDDADVCDEHSLFTRDAPRTIDGPSMRIGETVADDRTVCYGVLRAIRTALACQPGHELEAIAALVSAKDAYRERAERATRMHGDLIVELGDALPRAWGVTWRQALADIVTERDGLAGQLDASTHEMAYMRDRADAAIARAEKAERSYESMPNIFGVTRAKVAAAGGLDGSKGWWNVECDVAALRERADAAEAKLAKMRTILAPSMWHPGGATGVRNPRRREGLK